MLKIWVSDKSKRWLIQNSLHSNLVAMDGQYEFSARDEFWRIYEELRRLQVGQLDQGERIGKLENRRNEDSKLKSLWATANFHSPPDPFKGFDQGHPPLGMANAPIGLDPDEEPRRGASRANSVRFDETAIHGYYGQNGRSSTELPLRTGSGVGSLPLSERSSSYRSDGRLSSSGHSHHSARTDSLRLDTISRGLDSSFAVSSPITPPPGLFLLGPVPCIIRCWLTPNFSHETLLYAAICSGSSVSTLTTSLIHKLGMESLVFDERCNRYVNIPVHLSEASVHQASSLSASSEPQVPSLTVRFLVRELAASDDAIGIVIGSDVLQSHSADILLSKNRVVMLDDEHNHVSIPLVRPEKESAFKDLITGPIEMEHGKPAHPVVNGKGNVGVIGPPNAPNKPKHHSSSAPPNAPTQPKRRPIPILPSNHGPNQTKGDPKHRSENRSSPILKSPSGSVAEPINENNATPTKPRVASVWTSQNSKLKATASPFMVDPPRTMTVLRPSKNASKSTDPEATPTPPPEPSTPPPADPGAQYTGPTPSATPKEASNPVGVGSAFRWLSQSDAPVGNWK